MTLRVPYGKKKIKVEFWLTKNNEPTFDDTIYDLDELISIQNETIKKSGEIWDKLINERHEAKMDCLDD